MKRLAILLAGTSQTLHAVAQELQAHGHDLRITEQAPEASTLGGIDLLIDDGSSPLCTKADTPCLHLGLRLTLGAPDEYGLPQVHVACWQFGSEAALLLECQALSLDTEGNGQALRDQGLSAIVALATLQVSIMARSGGLQRFNDTPTYPQGLPRTGLNALDALAFEHRFNRTDQPWLMNIARTPIIERIDRCLLAHPQRPALSLAGDNLSYGELHGLALNIQQLMQAKLEGHAGTPVIALCLPKCPQLYGAILAILGCGAVYLPLDPESPVERQRYILQNAGADLLLHDGQHPLQFDRPALNIGGTGFLHERPLPPLQQHAFEEDAPCMALYTSGTTGQPKGVLLSQRNLSHFTAWYADYVQVKAQSRVLQFSTLSFDSSVMDIFPTFIQGAELVVPNEEQRRDPILLLALINQYGVSHGFLPPALLSILPTEPPLGLMHVMTGGDTCEPHVIERLANRCHFYNLYGPTEATVLVSARRFGASSHPRCAGQPIANSRVLILDEDLQPVGEHMTGELFIAGPGVALGYMNDPKQTAERYLPLPLPDGKTLRVYRTGDLAKWTAEGIELCGRRDNQVKIRGFRVEPEEIEHCLRESRLWQQVAVVIDHQRRILAFVARPQEAWPGSALERLKQHARQFLPDYMLPSLYTELPHLPATASGKMDRPALLKVAASLTGNPARRLPQNADERLLLELWGELLELPVSDISTDESFFNLGGHSILLSKMLLRLREQFGRSISINRFIEMPTLCRLATLISGTDSGVDISAQALRDAARPLDIKVLPEQRLGDLRRVVLTGANSFVGVHLLEALLACGAQEVACLVRDSPHAPAAERFAQALRENLLGHLDLSRVRVYAADISQPMLGLAPADYERIDREFGVLVHNAANVNHVLDYPSLVADNVEPILHCLRLCEGRSKKIFNFVSTLSACSSVDGQGHILEHPAAPTPPLFIRNGYNLSKWVAERLLQRACEQGVKVNLYRPGNISFNSQSGVCQPYKNRLMLMLKGSLQLGQVPAFALNFDLMPVDFLARFIAFHASSHQPDAAVFNLHNPQPLSWNAYVNAFRDAGRAFEVVSVSHWQQQLGRVDSDNALFGVLGFYLNGFEEDIGDISKIGHENASAGVHRMGAHYPDKTPALLRKGCDYLKQIHFI